MTADGNKRWKNRSKMKNLLQGMSVTFWHQRIGVEAKELSRWNDPGSGDNNLQQLTFAEPCLRSRDSDRLSLNKAAVLTDGPFT